MRTSGQELAADNRPTLGQFVLTDESNRITVPTFSESLAARTCIVEVWTFSHGEVSDTTGDFVDTGVDGYRT